MIPSHIFQFQHPIIVRKAPKNKYKFRQIAVIFQVGFVSFSVCSPDFSPHHVGGDDSVGPICAPVLFYLLIEKEKNRRGVRRSQLHAILMMAGRNILRIQFVGDGQYEKAPGSWSIRALVLLGNYFFMETAFLAFSTMPSAVMP